MWITNDPAFVATEQPDPGRTLPDPPSALSASPGDGGVFLAWTNPTAEGVRIVIRFRTDGQYPQSPADGLPVTSETAGGGASGAFTHSGLVNGTTCRYAAFAIDEFGNSSPAAQAEATPAP